MGIVRVAFLAASDRRIGSRDNDVSPETQDFGCEIGETIQVATREAIVDDDVLALDPAQVAQPELECVGHTLRRLAGGNGRDSRFGTPSPPAAPQRRAARRAAPASEVSRKRRRSITR